MKGLKTLSQMLGAIPIPCDKKGMEHFLETIEKNINKKARKPLGKTAMVRKTNIGKTNKQTY